MSFHFASTTFTVTKENYPTLPGVIIDSLCSLCPYLSPSESAPTSRAEHSNGMAGFFVNIWNDQWFGISPVALVDESVNSNGYIRHGTHSGLGGTGLYNTCILDVTYDDDGFVSAAITGYYNASAATISATFALLTDLRTGEDRVATFTQSTPSTITKYTIQEPTCVFLPATGQFYSIGKYPGSDMSSLGGYIAAGGGNRVCCAIPTLFYAGSSGVSNLMVWKNEKYRSCVFQGGSGNSPTIRGQTITIDGKQAIVMANAQGNSYYTNFILFE